MTDITQNDAAAGGVTVTGDAAKRIAFLMQQEGADAKLRIEVQGGGCSGFSYGFRFDSEVHADDLIIEKYGYGAFHDTVLNDELAEMGIGALIITGTVTQICVEETAREAFHQGYPTTIAADAVSSFDGDLHAATLRNFTMKFGWVKPSDQIIAEMTDQGVG